MERATSVSEFLRLSTECGDYFSVSSEGEISVA